MKHKKPEPHCSGAKPPAIEKSQIPKHVAVVMDGNGRWATQRGIPRLEGHRRGVEALRRAVRTAIERRYTAPG